MRNCKRMLVRILCVALLAANCANIADAHSGRTDSRGGHRDNKNASGLGSYHYHCGGYPAHLHDGGYCPYTDVFPSSVSVQTDKTTLVLGEKTEIRGTVYPANACDTSVSWESSDPGVVAVRSNALEAVGCGTATITATSFNGKTASVTITVQEKAVESVSIDQESIPVTLGETVGLEAVVTPADATDPTLNWQSDHPEIVSVSADGVISAEACGQAVISATAKNGVSDSVTISVSEVVAESVSIEGESELEIGSATQLQAVFNPADTTDQTVTWEIGDTDIATIDEDGMVTACGVGTTTVYAKQKDVETAFELTVLPIPVSEIEITCDTEEKLAPGDTAVFNAKVSPEDATYPEVSWSTSDERIATIDESGVLQAQKGGEVTVVAETADGCRAEYVLQIDSPIPETVAGICAVGVIAGVVVLRKKKKKA